MASDALMQTYRRMPVAFSSGAGAWLTDAHGQRYLDALSGIAVCGLGHAHAGVTAAIAAQAGALLHTSNLYEVPAQERLAERLCELSGMQRVFFSNSGAEANEAAIKLARLHGHRQGHAEPTIIVVEGAFHGRTMATVSATGNRKVQAGFEPLLSGFARAPYDDVDAIARVGDNHPQVVAVLIEPILGEGGVQMPQPGYVRALRELCDARGWLLMLDEVQTGNGRTGRFFAYQHEDVLPDVVTTAKGLGNGVPIGACLAQGAAADVLGPGSHGSTFGGNPLVCAAALAVLDALQHDGLMVRASELGERIRNGLREQLAGCNHVVDIRGLGLMIGVELSVDATSLVARALEQRLLINVTQERVVRLLPPLILDDAEADQIVEQVASLVRELPAATGA